MSGDVEQSTLPTPETPRKHRKLRRTLIIGGTILGVLLVAAAGGAFALYQKFQQIKIIQVEGLDTPAEEDAPLNILLLGSDSRKGKNMAKYGLDAGREGQRSDTTILLHISGDRSNALAVSIPRDLWVEQPSCAAQYRGEYAKFNNAFDQGGAACTLQLVEQITDVDVNHVVVVDFNGFKAMIDAIGGVEVCVKEPIHDPDSLLDLPAGTTTVTGDQALAFVRARKTVGDGSDIGRIKRQQLFLSAAIRKVSDPSFLLNPGRVYTLLDTATQALTVSQGLDGVGPMRNLVDSVRGIRPSDVTFVTTPFVYREDGANVDLDSDAAQPLWDAMNNDTPWPPPVTVAADGQKLTVAPKDIWVTVVNASGGTVTDDEIRVQLEDAGFNLDSSSDGGSRATTKVRYPTGLQDSARTVAYATSSQATQDDRVGGVTIVVGKDWTGVKTDLVVAKPKSTTEDSTTKADQVVCAN